MKFTLAALFAGLLATQSIFTSFDEEQLLRQKMNSIPDIARKFNSTCREYEACVFERAEQYEWSYNRIQGKAAGALQGVCAQGAFRKLDG